MAPGQTFEAGRYRVTALRARHAEEQQALLYLVERGGRSALYAADTRAFHGETWAVLERLSDEGVRLDAAIVEGTMGFKELPANGQHLPMRGCGEHHEQLRSRGLTTPGCRHLATHFSPAAGRPPHEETAAFLAPYGAEPAYDGMEGGLGVAPAAWFS